MSLRKRNKRRRKELNADVMRRGVFFLPSLVTTASLFCGFFSIIKSFNGEFRWAAFAIFAAAIFDFFDGFVARLTHSSTEFGLQYDSLSDLMSFGLAPALLAYSWALQPFGRMGWLAAFLYFACAALRLARYNVQAHKIERNYFQGLPTPAAAGTIASGVLFYHYFASMYAQDAEMRHFSAVPAVFVLAFLMISTFRYRNFKHLNLRNRHPFQYLVMAVLILILIAWEPEVTLFLMACVYISHGPFESIVFFQRRRAERLAQKQAPQTTAAGATPPAHNSEPLPH